MNKTNKIDDKNNRRNEIVTDINNFNKEKNNLKKGVMYAIIAKKISKYINAPFLRPTFSYDPEDRYQFDDFWGKEIKFLKKIRAFCEKNMHLYLGNASAIILICTKRMAMIKAIIKNQEKRFAQFEKVKKRKDHKAINKKIKFLDYKLKYKTTKEGFKARVKEMKQEETHLWQEYLEIANCSTYSKDIEKKASLILKKIASTNKIVKEIIKFSSRFISHPLGHPEDKSELSGLICTSSNIHQRNKKLENKILKKISFFKSLRKDFYERQKIKQEEF